MNYVDALLEDPCGLSAAALVLCLIGSRAVADAPKLRQLGAALAGAVLLLTFWLGVYRRIDVLGLAVTSVAWGFFTLGTAWVVLALAAFAAQALVVAPARRLRSAWARLRARPPVRREPPPPLPESDADRAARRRRDDARAALELFYTLNERRLSAVMPRPAYESYVKRFLPDGEDPAVVEARARAVREALTAHLAAAPAGDAGAMAELQQWHDRSRARIDGTPGLDPRARENLVTALNQQMEERLRRLLEEQ
jgi:hypothetical protein